MSSTLVEYRIWTYLDAFFSFYFQLFLVCQEYSSFSQANLLCSFNKIKKIKNILTFLIIISKKSKRREAFLFNNSKNTIDKV